MCEMKMLKYGADGGKAELADIPETYGSGRRIKE
jgi:hypothetical protein